MLPYFASKEPFISELAVTILAHCGFVKKPHCAVFNSILNTIRKFSGKK